LGEELKQSENKIIVGTSGFSYPDWVGVFYPHDLPKSRWLEHYAQQFSFCELNFSYYRMPTPAQMEKYQDHSIEFALKAHRSLTHDRVDTDHARISFLEAARVLGDSKALSAVLLQFPYSFGYTATHRKYLLELLSFLSELPLVVEFRHPAWIKDSVFAELRQHGWGISMIDSPRVPGGMPDYEALTSEIGYLRFHGRNNENWWTGSNVSRYDYEYSPEELEAWVPRIMEMSKAAKTVYISFNNHARGQAIKNANQLRGMLANQN
jgi:uncharacterized protein YecE (DUF72 family)